MAKTRFYVLEILRKAGIALFGMFCRWEENKILPGFSRWIKVSVLTGFIAAIGALSGASMLGCHCYAPIDPWPQIHSSSAAPNPTAGADTVTVEARVEIMEPAKQIITKAEAILEGDTTQMETKDGAFDSREEDLTAKLYVGAKQPGSATIQIDVYNEEGDWNTDELQLEITEE